MSSLRTKLARLNATSLLGQRQSPPAAAPKHVAEAVGGGESSASRAPGASESRVLIATLREKIARIMAREPPAKPLAFNPASGELPFIELSTATGPLYVREIAWEAQHRVGRFPVSAAQRADATMLSLLSLDPSLASVDVQRALYLDTETTGLSGGTGTLAFLVGLGFFDSEARLHLEQLLLRRPGEEAPLLARLSERLRSASMIVTFNGKAFDMPLIRTRFVMNRLEYAESLPHLDLLHVARRIHRRRIGTCSLGAIESKVLGFERVDDVPSCEVSARYGHFLRTGDKGALLGVVEHNALDVTAMAALVGLYGGPVEEMAVHDMAAMALTLHRARSPERAMSMAEQAVARGGGHVAHRARAALAKAHGDRDRALKDLEVVVREVDDPAARLELAKLYEHYCKKWSAALALVEQGTSETEQASAWRIERLRRKMRLESQFGFAREPQSSDPARKPGDGSISPRRRKPRPTSKP